MRKERKRGLNSTWLGVFVEPTPWLGYKGQYKVTTLHWAAFRNATRHWLQEKPNGLLYFRHQSLRSAVEHKLLGKA